MKFLAALCILLLLKEASLQKFSDSRLPLCTTPNITCKESYRYRSYDGSCNNEERPWFGVAGRVFERLIPAQYGLDGLQKRLSKSGDPLPNPRTVSNIFNEEVERRSPYVSHMHVMWGQFAAHDVSHNTILKNDDGTDLDCDCTEPHPDCDNIPLLEDDIQFREGGKKCLPFSKSRVAHEENCRYEEKEQINRVTSYIDGSAVYGSSMKELDSIREKKSKAGEIHSGVQTSGSHRPHSFCETKSKCFPSGDPRGGENPALLSFHTIWIRYHNHLARRLSVLNPKWSSSKVFKVTRTIVASLIQMITYEDYLPPLLGEEWLDRFGLRTVSSGYWQGYDPEYNPGITNAFSTAAFRFGHSQVSSVFSLTNPHYSKSSQVVQTSSMFTFEPNVTDMRYTFGEALRGLMVDEALKTDTAIVDGMRNHLFRKRNESFGNDLFATNIQRGRDHGLPGYNQYRNLCGLKLVDSIRELSGEIPEEKISLLERAYQSVDDVDLFVGGLAEDPVPGGLVGPTFACILAYQFRALRKGDRHWYEGGSSLTVSQIQSLRKVTFSKILCETGEDMAYVMTYPMLLATDRRNDIIKCDTLPELDLSPWAEGVDKVKAKFENVQFEWTVWFPTNARSSWVLNTATATAQIRAEREDQICAEVLDHETRSIPHSPYVQIRFKCGPGTIAVTNFPGQLSDKFRWTNWVQAKTSQYADGLKVEKSDFSCSHPVALQLDSSSVGFSLAEADVFEANSVDKGIVCRHRDQLSGNCQNFRARALCSRNDQASEAVQRVLDKTVMESFMSQFFEKLCSMMNICLPNGQLNVV